MQTSSTRVVGAQHSQLYANAFSREDAATKDVESLPSNERQPKPCCWPCLQHTGGGPANPAFREVLEIDAASKTLLVGTGYTFKECKPVLALHGFILHGTPEVDTISIGGAIAVGAHGGGRF